MGERYVKQLQDQIKAIRLTTSPNLGFCLQTQGVYLHQFVLHAALDAVNEQVWTTTSMHLGTVDKFNNLMVAAYATAAHVKFLLLHDGRNEETIRLFFRDVYEIYVRVRMGQVWAKLVKPQLGNEAYAIQSSVFRMSCRYA